MRFAGNAARHRTAYRGPHRVWLFSTLLGAALLALVVPETCAGTGDSVTLPAARVRARSGLRLDVDTRWVDGNGYRPVRIRVTPIRGGNATADRRLEVTLTPFSWRNATTAVTAIVDLNQGSPWGETVVPIPCSQPWRSIAIATREGGRSLRDLTASQVHFVSQHYGEWNEASPSVLFVDRDVTADTGMPRQTMTAGGARVVPDFRALASLLPMNNANYAVNVADVLNNSLESTTDAQLLQLLDKLPRLDVLPPQDLPTDWIALTSVDLIVVSLEDLRAWQQEYPDQFQAARAWLSTGTVLCVYGVGDEFDKLEELERLLELPQLGSDPLRGWQSPDPREIGKPAFDPKISGNRGFVADPIPPEPTDAEEFEESTPFVGRAAEQGWLVAMGSEDPFPGSVKQWKWMLRTVGSGNWMWYRRYGVSMQRENHDYWNLLIPGVGEAPVNSFLVLISLFVIVIGPVNYYWLRRQKRLYLLLVTVPLGALLVTSCLLLYAVVTDGMGVRSRIRSISHIDQRSQRSVTCSRQSYYAGLTPSGGLVFPQDAAVIPVDFRPQQLAVTNQGRRMEWRSDQRLRGGYFPSRSTTQFTIVESRETVAEIEVGAINAEGELPVTNRLGVEVTRLVLHGLDGQYFGAQRLADGQSKDLSTVDLKSEKDFWSKLVAANRPKYPDGFDPYQIDDATRLFGMNVSTGTQWLTSPSFTSSVMERRLPEVNDLAKLPLGQYVALVSQGPELSLGTVSKQTGFHLVLGVW